MARQSRQHAKQMKQALRETKKIEKKAEHARIKHAWKTKPWAERPKEFSSDYTHKWNVHEEVVNSITHGIGVLLGIAALVLMVVYATMDGSVYGIVSGAIFGASLIIAYASSAIYHAILYPPIKRFFRIMDHSCIFLLIAGTYTPFCLVTLNGPLGWTLFGVVWGLAIIGITMKFLYFDSFKVLSTAIYIGMGWLAVAVVVQLLHNLPLWGCLWMLAGGLAYTIGVIFFVYERVPFFHAVWHLFVLAGSICHFFAIYFYVMPVRVFG
jgi:hemolysin III